MENLRITPKRTFVDSFSTGDSQAIFTYEVRRDWEQNKDGLSLMPTAQSVIDKGVVIETFNSEDNANIFLKALEQNNVVESNSCNANIFLKALEQNNVVESNSCENYKTHNKFTKEYAEKLFKDKINRQPDLFIRRRIATESYLIAIEETNSLGLLEALIYAKKFIKDSGVISHIDYQIKKATE